MENCIITAFIKNFTLKHDILVYSKGVCIKTIKVETSDIASCIDGLCKKYKTETINLCGNRNYLLKFSEELKTKYSHKRITIVEI
jgi:hypothetical protein